MSEASPNYMRDLEMAMHPDRWPVWPQLPLKRSTSEYGDLRSVGRLIERGLSDPPQIQPIVYLGVIFTKPNPDERIEYPSLEAVFEDGWRVD